MTAALRIFIARHGETEWNLIRRFQGHRDSPLTVRGRDQAQRLAERLAPESLSAVYSSDLGRSVETADLVAAPHGLTILQSQSLREIDCGQWTGQAKEDLARHSPDAVECYRLRPWEHRMPDGESLADVQARGLEFIHAIAPMHRGETVAVITHHIVVETLLARALGLGLDQLWLRIPTGNCYVSQLEYEAGVLRPLVVYDGAHLGGTSQPYFEGERVA